MRKSLPIGSSDEPLLRGRLDHVVQLQPGGGELLGGGLVLPLAPPPPPRHDQEDEEAGGGDEEGAAHHGANDQGDVARARGGLLFCTVTNILYRLMLTQNGLAHRCSSRGSDYKDPTQPPDPIVATYELYLVDPPLALKIEDQLEHLWSCRLVPYATNIQGGRGTNLRET